MKDNTIENSFNYDVLSQSYCEGINKIITNGNVCTSSFQLPSTILQKRHKFWDSFFDKYLEELSDDIELGIDTLKPEKKIDGNFPLMQRMITHKSADVIQDWINTGSINYLGNRDNNKSSESGSSLSEDEMLSIHYNPAIDTGLEKRTVAADNSSCSSVDTAIYILSNANVTKKAETMAILEGAKSSDIMDPLNKTSENLSVGNGNLLDNNSKKHHNSPLTPRSEAVYKTPQKNTNSFLSNLIFDKSAALRTFIEMTRKTNRYSQTMSNDSIPKCNESIDEASKSLIRNTENINTPEDDSLQLQETSLTANSMSHRKKLYTGRDSPVDLVRMTCHNDNRISKSRQSSHPAFDLPSLGRFKKLKKRVRCGKRRKSHAYALKKGYKSSTTDSLSGDSQNENLETDDTTRTSSTKNSRGKSTTPSISAKRSKFRRKRRTKKANCIDRRALIDITKFKSVNLEPKVCLERLPETFIQRYSKHKAVPLNMNPVVRLTRISELEIQKYNTSDNIKKGNQLNALPLHNESRTYKNSSRRNSSKNSRNLASETDIIGNKKDVHGDRCSTLINEYEDSDTILNCASSNSPVCTLDTPQYLLQQIDRKNNKHVKMLTKRPLDAALSEQLPQRYCRNFKNNPEINSKCTIINNKSLYKRPNVSINLCKDVNNADSSPTPKLSIRSSKIEPHILDDSEIIIERTHKRTNSNNETTNLKNIKHRCTKSSRIPNSISSRSENKTEPVSDAIEQDYNKNDINVTKSVNTRSRTRSNLNKKIHPYTKRRKHSFNNSSDNLNEYNSMNCSKELNPLPSTDSCNSRLWQSPNGMRNHMNAATKKYIPDTKSGRIRKRLFFQTKIYESDTESASISSTPSLNSDRE